MVDMVSQTRKIEVLVTNLKDWEALYAKLKSLQENSIEVGDFDLAKIMADAKKYIENVAGGRKEEYDDLIRKIQKAAKSIRDGGEEQKQRLDEFIGKNLEGEISSLIPDQDLLFLTKESTRYQGSLKSLQSQKDETLDASTKIDVDMKAKNKGLTIAPEDLHSLRQNLKALEKQLTVDIPRIKKNIDMLEAFAIKALKNKLNEDNKKSQNQISQMKRNYEDLQREIDNLNNKLAKVKDDSTEL
jgi:chromosome segregation ATPase